MEGEKNNKMEENLWKQKPNSGSFQIQYNLWHSFYSTAEPSTSLSTDTGWEVWGLKWVNMTEAEPHFSSNLKWNIAAVRSVPQVKQIKSRWQPGTKLCLYCKGYVFRVGENCSDEDWGLSCHWGNEHNTSPQIFPIPPL